MEIFQFKLSINLNLYYNFNLLIKLLKLHKTLL